MREFLDHLKLFLYDNALLVTIVMAKLAINLVAMNDYGYFRDELYYIACSKHLDWGYVDQPPLCAVILAVTRWLFGDSLYAIRFPAALAGAAVVVLAAMMARKLGGDRFSQTLAALAAAFSPVIMGNAGRYYSMNAFDLFFWALAAFTALTIIMDKKPQGWPWFGLVIGLGLLNKYSMGFFVIGLVVGLLLTRERRQLLDLRFWLGTAVAFVIFLPHIIWQVQNDLPSLEFMRRAAGEKNVAISISDFLIGQFMQTGFIQSLLWLPGVAFFFFHRDYKNLRFFGWSYVVVFIIMVLSHAKVYYLTPIYSLYMAAGACWFGSLAGKTLRIVLVALLLVLSLAVLPFAIPILRVNDFISYSQKLGLTPRAEERSPVAELPQYYADMFGWPEMVEQIAAAYHRLSPEEQAACVIYVRNYGEAAAVDFFGPKYGLPPALCAHNSYWYWKPPKVNFKAAVIIGAEYDLESNLADLQGPGRFQQVELAATTNGRYAMPFENGRQIFICRGPQFSFDDIWPDEKFFI